MKPKTESQCLANASSQTSPPGYTYSIATLAVSNNCDKAVIATLEWTGQTPAGAAAPNVPIDDTLTIRPHSTATSAKALNIVTDSVIQMRVISADWAS